MYFLSYYSPLSLARAKASMAILSLPRLPGNLTPRKRVTLARQNYTARLDKKSCLSESAQCYHFEFVVDELESFPLTPASLSP